jgi:hypothetical protein
VRTKAIIIGGLAALALAGVTANAGNRASQAVQGSTWQAQLASLKPAFAAVAQNCAWRQP